MISLDEYKKQFESELSGLRGTDLVGRLAEILAQQEQKIGTLEATIQLLNAYEESRDLLLTVNENVSGELMQPVANFTLGAAEHLSRDDGFHAIEFDNAGNPFRWAGENGVLTFTCYVDRSRPVYMTLDLLNVVDQSNYENIEFFDGDNQVQVSVAKTSSLGRTISAKLPPRQKAGGPTHLPSRC